MGVLEKTCVACVSQHFGPAERKESAHFAHRRSARQHNTPTCFPGESVGGGEGWGAARACAGFGGGNSRVSRLQVHSLSQALLVSSKLGMGVFPTLCSLSRCFLLSG